MSDTFLRGGNPSAEHEESVVRKFLGNLPIKALGFVTKVEDSPIHVEKDCGAVEGAHAFRPAGFTPGASHDTEGLVSAIDPNDGGEETFTPHDPHKSKLTDAKRKPGEPIQLG